MATMRRDKINWEEKNMLSKIRLNLVSVRVTKNGVDK